MIPTPFTPQMATVEVTFNAALIGTGTSPLSTSITDDPLFVPQGLTIIVFRLKTINGDHEARFQTTPIQWFLNSEDGSSTNSPALFPGMFMFQRIGDQIVTLLDFNTNPSDEPFDKNHHFNVVVTYGGETYGSDPTIINEPPST